jgi:septum formation protein
MTVRRVVLASGSPRRRALLEAACLEVVVRPSGVDESWPGGTLVDGAVTLARRKAVAVPAPAEVVVAADTLVALDEHRLEKPTDRADAARMLRILSGRRHEVVTGFCVQRDGHERAGAVTTHVTFRNLSDQEIDRYVATGEPLDKAGAYGIQGEGGSLVDRVEGSYTNVVGLPLAEVLAAIGVLS